MRHLFSILLLFIPATAFSHPGIGIVKDSRGNIYYTDLAQVWKIDKKGERSIVVKGVHTHELYMDTNDDLYGEHLWYNGEKLDTWGHYVWCLRSNGKLDTIIEPSAGLLEGYSFNRDGAGNMYYVQRFTISRFNKVTPSGEVTTIAEGKFKDIRWIHVTPGGVLYFIDLVDLYKIEKGKVIQIAKNLHERTSLLGYGSLKHNIFGIWLDRHENIYVAVLGGQVVKKITQDGKVSNLVYSTGSWRPGAGLFDDEDNLWLMENSITNRVRVRKISKEELSRTPSALIHIIQKIKPILLLSVIVTAFGWLAFFVVKKIIARKTKGRTGKSLLVVPGAKQ